MTVKLQILIPAYNAERFIEQTINSVLIQSYENWEVVVFDNASNDATVSVVEKFQDSRISCIKNQTNVGAIGNHNIALKFATSDYFKILSADDVLAPGVLAKQVAALEENPEVGLVTCNCVNTDENLVHAFETKYLPGLWEGNAAIAMCAKKVANLIGAPSNLMMRRSAVGDVRFDPSLKWLGDLDFACQILKSCSYRNIDEIGFLYRRHDLSDTAQSCPPSIRIKDEVRFLVRYGLSLAAVARIAFRYLRSFR